MQRNNYFFENRNQIKKIKQFLVTVDKAKIAIMP